jgi:hypothetical protein
MRPVIHHHDLTDPMGHLRSDGDPLVLFLGHHKCASSWIVAVLREASYRLAWRFRVVHRPEDWQRLGYDSLAEFVRSERPHVLAYTNADAADLDGLPAWRGLHVVRDPRDVWVSGYFSHLHSHPTTHWPELETHRRRLAEVAEGEGLWLELAFSDWVFKQMGEWDYNRPNVLEMQMEALSADPRIGFTRALGFLGMLAPEAEGKVRRAISAALPRLNALHYRGRHRVPFSIPLSPFRLPLRALPASEVVPIVERKSFERLSGGRKKGEEDVRSHFRKGKPGDWKNHLTDDHLALFEGRYPGLIEHLGYAPAPA